MTKVTAEKLISLREAARNSEFQTKSAARYAAAHAFVFFKFAADPTAHPDCRDWLKNEIIKVNLKVKKAKLEKTFLWEESKKYATGTLSEEGTKALLQKMTDSQARALACLSKVAMNKGLPRKVVFEEGKAKTAMPAAVKYVFAAYTGDEAPSVSRYVKVLSWVDENVELTKQNDVEAIASAIDRVGFERIARATTSAPKPPTKPLLERIQVDWGPCGKPQPDQLVIVSGKCLDGKLKVKSWEVEIEEDDEPFSKVDAPPTAAEPQDQELTKH